VAGWICDGVPKDGKQYSNQNPQGKHDPYENFGSDCVICGLPKDAMGGNAKAPIKLIASLITTLFVLGLGAVGFTLFKPVFQSCSAGQQKVGDTCVAVTPSAPAAVGTQIATPSPVVTSTPVTSGTYKTLAEVPNVPTLKVKYGGSTSFAPLRNPQIVARIQQAHPGYELIYTEPSSGDKPGSGSGIKMLLDGLINFAQSSRPLKADEKSAAQLKNITLEEKAVALDGIAVYVNPEINIPGLTISQVKDIFTGKITNWSQVGGSNIPIVLVSRDPKDGGTPEYFFDQVLGTQPFATSVQPYAADTTTSIRKVAQNKGGIGYATASEVCNQTKIKSLPLAKDGNPTPVFVPACTGALVNSGEFSTKNYPLTRQLFIVIKNNSKEDQQAGEAYVNMLLSDEGQQLVNLVGLVRIRQ
jgi:phosphate transport system substrate-binding protein